MLGKRFQQYVTMKFAQLQYIFSYHKILREQIYYVIPVQTLGGHVPRPPHKLGPCLGLIYQLIL